MRPILAALLSLAVVFSCANENPAGTTDDGQRFPDVTDVEVIAVAERTYRFDVTISSPYDTPERYADAWRVKAEDGTVFGIRELLHDHEGEQPFTRSLSGIEIPSDVQIVVVEARDLQYGWGGKTLTVEVP